MKHTKIDNENLSILIGSALEVKESEAKKDEFSNLPSGHPLRVAMESAKKRYEEEQEKLKKQEELQQKIKTKRTKRAKQKQDDSEQQEKKRVSLRKIKDINSLLEEMVIVMDKNEKEINKIADGLDDIPEFDMRLTRLKRVLSASKRGVMETMINPRQIKD